MKINESFLIIIIFIILIILFANNKKYKKNKNNIKYEHDNNDNDIDNDNRVYYRNSHSVYRNDIYSYKPKDNEYKKYRYNIDNYTIKQKLLKESEFNFYNILKSSINPDYIICPKVKISNFIEMIDRRSWEDYYDKINYQSIDFLICNNLFKPIFGIILFYGNPQIQTENEKFLIEIYSSINLPVLRLEISKNYSNDIIKEKIENLLNINNNKNSG